MFLNNLTFLRVIDLAQLGEAANLSNRDLVWPYFQAAITASPLFGWGVGRRQSHHPRHFPAHHPHRHQRRP